MNSKILFVSLFALCLASILQAQQPSDPVAENVFPPDLVLQYQAEIGLTDDQRSALLADVEKAQQRFAPLQEQLQKETEALGTLLKKEHVEERAVLDQFEKLLQRDADTKRAYLALMLTIKNKLTAEQQKKLREIKGKIVAGQIKSPADLQRVLEAKLKKVEAGVQRWQDDGRDPSPIAEMMEEFHTFMKQAKHKDAEALLDRVLKRLDEKEKN